MRSTSIRTVCFPETACFFIIIGLAATFFVMAFDYRKLKKYARPALWVAFLLLVLVLVPHIGREVGGARRWFRFKFISFQPSSYACIALIIYIADFIERKGNFIRSIRWGLAPAIIILGLMAGLVLVEPDLGTTLALCLVVFIMLYVAGVTEAKPVEPDVKPVFLFGVAPLRCEKFLHHGHSFQCCGYRGPLLEPEKTGYNHFRLCL